MTRPRFPLRAYALPLVFGLVMMLSVVLTTVLIGIAGSVNIGESMLHRRQAFHAAEGVSLAAMELAGQKLRTLPVKPDLPPNDPGFAAAMATLLRDNELQTSAFINANRSLVTPAGYEVGEITVSGLGVAAQTQLNSGPFNGMLAQVQPLNLNVAVTRVHDRSPASQFVTASIQRATVSLFQFYVFSDVYLDLDPGGPVVTSGRIHTNSDFCVAGEPRINTVTAAGRILMSNRDGQQCRRRAGESNDIQIATDDGLPPATAQLTKDHESPGWVAYAQNTFHGHVLDSAHNVSPLKMPINGKPRVQAGSNVLAQERVAVGGDLAVPIPDAKEDNTTNMRFLVDPMLTVEPADVQQQKFAFQADIRIIDGVWYLKKPDAPLDIGQPIWSDHAGSVATASSLYVGNQYADVKNAPKGQEDIRTSESWGPSAPQRYSYYGMRRDGAGAFAADRTSASPRAVISYGLLKNTGDAEHTLVPGFYSSTAPTTPTLVAAANMDQLLKGTTSGFKDGWIEVRSESTSDPTAGSGQTSDESQRSRMLPINFDVLAFLDALKTCGPGKELGTYFDLCGGTRHFNGIVYIAVTWPGSMDGLGTTFAATNFAKLWPFHGDGDGLADTVVPANLCVAESATAVGVTNVAGTPTLPPCASTNRASGNFPNIVRVFNAAHISPRSALSYGGVGLPADYMPAGLTIATNVSIVASGDINVDTTPRRAALEPPTATDHFVPFLLAGDRFHRHSVAWDDAAANWRQLMKDNGRVAADTIQFMEILAGWNPTPVAKPGGHDHSSDGFEDFPRYNENWGAAGKKSTTFGSIVVGFASVYERTGANNGDGNIAGFTTSFPIREEGFDFHLEDPANQPPGTPQLLAQSIGFWQTR